MTYLVCDNGNYKELETKEELTIFLKRKCFENFITFENDCSSWEELYNYCMGKQWFGDIAQVYTINTYRTTPDGFKFSCHLYSIDRNTPYELRRVL